MKLPKGKMKSEELNAFFEESIEYHIKLFYDKISEYEPISLFNDWRLLLQCIDELINIPFEIKNDVNLNLFLNSKINLKDQTSFLTIKKTVDFLKERFDENVARRYYQTMLMTSSINLAFIEHQYYDIYDNTINLNDAKNSINFFQSRRIYFVATLFLIPKIAKGNKKSEFIHLLNDFLQILDSCLVNITTSYHKLLVNNSISDFEMVFDDKKGIGNFNFNQLESFYLNPQRLSLMDQLEFRKEDIEIETLIGKNVKKIFSFSEIADTMILLSCAFKKYNVESTNRYKELNILFQEIAYYLNNDYDIIIDEPEFEKIQNKFKDLELYNDSVEYFTNLNSISPFQKSNKKFYSTVVLLNRYAYNLILNDLISNRKFQVNSGFIFENRISEILESNGFIDAKITRINRKEFDIVAIKNGKIYNFQCKNNFYNISDINRNYKVITGLNRRLCKYYERAIIKEIKRENLLIEKLGISNIEHFVVSRFPVITRNEKIINFNSLDEWLKTN